MTAITLQKRLIKKISETDTISVLKIIENILIENEKPVKLSAFQKKLIDQSEEQYKNGSFIEHTELMNKLAIKYGL